MTAYFQTLDCSATVVPQLQRNPSIVKSVTASGTATLKRAPNRILKATSTVVVSLRRNAFKTLRVTAVLITTKVVNLSRSMSLIQATTGIVLIRTINKIFDPVVASVVSALARHRMGASGSSIAFADRKWSVDIESSKWEVTVIPRFTYTTDAD